MAIRTVQIRIAENVRLNGDLSWSPNDRAIILFAHGSGSSRKSPRNGFVASELNKAGLATLLLDLLTMDEESVDDAGGALRFDIQLLASRLSAAIVWLKREKDLANLPIGLFGASTGSAAAIVAAAQNAQWISAVVSRGGRPDLAASHLALLKAPILLIVGGNDQAVIEFNEQAALNMTCEHQIEIVPGATHLFEEPGALAQVAALSSRWFLAHIPPVSSQSNLSTAT